MDGALREELVGLQAATLGIHRQERQVLGGGPSKNPATSTSVRQEADRPDPDEGARHLGSWESA